MRQGPETVLRRDASKMIATLLLTIISIGSSLLGFYDEYPYGHILTIGLCVFAVSLLIYLNIYKEGFVTTLSFRFISAISLSLGVLWFFVVGPNLPPETAQHGWLLPSNESTGPTDCPIEPGELAIDIGSNVTFVRGNISPAILLEVDTTQVIRVEKQGDRLLFDADVYDEKREIVAKVDRGEFHLNSNKIFYITRSDDRRRLTVYDNNNNTVLDIIYYNPHYVSITGIFYSKEGRELS